MKWSLEDAVDAVLQMKEKKRLKDFSEAYWAVANAYPGDVLPKLREVAKAAADRLKGEKFHKVLLDRPQEPEKKPKGPEQGTLFGSAEEALQHLADVTGKKVVIASRLDRPRGLTLPKEGKS